YVMKKEKITEIVELVESFCKQYFTGELTACALRLCDKLCRIRTLDITRGKKEIWAASIVYVIARVNFLFDKANNNFLTSDIICDFFGTKKTTTGNKATSIEKTLNIGIGDTNYCTTEIIESFSFVETPNGFILPQKMAKDIFIRTANEAESREINEFMAEKKRQEEEVEQTRKERRAEINREIAKKKRKKKEEKQAKINARQLKLW
ncbi:MAG: DUF6398 domain-containing protein, partial [Thermodesulfobacteriota bacterium]|nr:DUF6398 domain-containing protein [Thermodesulfobacteriota bacterium]